ncbi:hypothetical protein ABPG72_009971 [Tetrahymena utriculariae]
MGNTTCLCQKTQIQSQSSLQNSRIIYDPQLDYVTKANTTPNLDNKSQQFSSIKQAVKSKTAKINQKYGTRNCIEEEDVSSYCESGYSEMMNNSIYHLSSLISNGPLANNKNDQLDTKNSLALLAGTASNSSSSAQASTCKQTNNISQKNQSSKVSLKNKQYQQTLEVIVQTISLSFPEGDRIKQGQKVILRHINTETNLHSHYRKYEKGSKQQEVSVCTSRLVHQHDFWTIDTSQNYFEQLNQSNRVWAQIGQIYPTEDATASQSNECLIANDSELIAISSSKFVNQDSSSVDKSPYITSSDEVILKHHTTQKELASSEKFISQSTFSQQVYCDELGDNFQEKQNFNWRLIIHNSDGYLRENSIIQIIHSETNKPLRTNKHNGILSNTSQVVCGNKQFSIYNRQMSDFWIISSVQPDISQVEKHSENNS